MTKKLLLVVAALVAAAIPASANRAVMEMLAASNNAIYVDTVNARVGISTITPATTLDVAGNAQFGRGATKSTFSVTGSLSLPAGASFTVAGSSFVVMNSSVGVGTATPGRTVDILSSTNNEIIRTSRNSLGDGPGLGIDSQGAHNHGAIYMSGTEVAATYGGGFAFGTFATQTADPPANGLSIGGGNLGVGTNSPTQKIHMSSGTLLVDGTAGAISIPAGTVTAATFSGAGTGLTGTAASLTAGSVTTNANLTGGVTSVGNAATVVTNANLTGDVTSVGNATTAAATQPNITTLSGLTSITNPFTITKTTVTEMYVGSTSTSNIAGAWTTWTPTFTGFSVNPTISAARYIKIGKLCTIYLKAYNGSTSNATSMTITLPFAAANTDTQAMPVMVVDVGSFFTGIIQTTANSATASVFNANFTNFTNSGNKGVYAIFTYETN